MTDRTLQQLLHAIAEGVPNRPRVHWHKAVLCQVCGDPPGVCGEPTDAGTSCGARYWARVPTSTVKAVEAQPGLWEELVTTILRQSRTAAPASGGKSSETAVPFHEAASGIAHQLRNAVTTWARLFAEEYDLDLTATTVPDAARWMATFPALLDGHPAAGEMRAELAVLVREAERVIDQAPGHVYAGQCGVPLDLDDDEAPLPMIADLTRTRTTPCPGQLYAREDKLTVDCRRCGSVHSVPDRVNWMEGLLADQMVTAAEAVPVLIAATGKPVTRNNIAAWRRDGKVEVHDGGWYRYGDLLELARDMKVRQRKEPAA